jgi:hypothetical protein
LCATGSLSELWVAQTTGDQLIWVLQFPSSPQLAVQERRRNSDRTCLLSANPQLGSVRTLVNAIWMEIARMQERSWPAIWFGQLESLGVRR